MTTRQKRIQDAIDALADLYEYGHLTAIASPDELLMMAVREIQLSRKLQSGEDPDDEN